MNAVQDFQKVSTKGGINSPSLNDSILISLELKLRANVPVRKSLIVDSQSECHARIFSKGVITRKSYEKKLVIYEIFSYVKVISEKGTFFSSKPSSAGSQPVLGYNEKADSV